MTHYDELFITHNHGFLHLIDVTVDEEGNTAEGTVVDGATTSTLWTASLTKNDKPGVRMSRNLWGRTIRFSESRNRHEVDICFCG